MASIHEIKKDKKSRDTAPLSLQIFCAATAVNSLVILEGKTIMAEAVHS